MLFGTAFILVALNQALAQLIPRPDVSCDYRHTLRRDQKLEVNNPKWPVVYKQGSVCRWIFDCPTSYVCVLHCHYVALPQSEDCSEDKLLVSTLGSNWLANADKYCGRTVFKAKSVNYRITMGLISSSNSPGGRFRCKVSPEPAM